MSKVRVYEIAKEVGIDSKTLVSKLQQMGYPVRSHASVLEEPQAKEIVEKINQEKKGTVEVKRLAAGVIRRRASATPAPETPPSPEAREEEILQQATKPVEPEPPPAPAPAEPEPAAPVEAEAEPAPAAGEAEQPPPAEVPEAEEKKPAPAGAPRKEKEVYRATVVRRVDPALIAPKPAVEKTAPPKGVRVLRVITPGDTKESELSKRDISRAKAATAARQERVELREQLYDAFVTGYVPSLARKRKLLKKTARKTQLTTPKAQKRVIKMEAEYILASELARRMGIKHAELNRKLAALGEKLEAPDEDAQLDFDTASVLAQEFDFQVVDASFKEEKVLQAAAADADEEAVIRAPVVTVMGHVDHGKTSILDAIRKTKVAEGEAGGITQHIGAYEVHLPRGSITFIDTPGHEAFTAMRARGAKLTDIVVLVVAADDGIMPQTIEAIHHAQDANVPIIVAINKIDLPGVQPDRIRQKLTEYGLVPEAWGGSTQVVEVSAKTKVGLDNLLEAILLQAEIMELKAHPKRPASGTVVEARLDKGRGPIATLLVADGTLHKGDIVVVGTTSGRVRAALDFEGRPLDECGPGRPVQVQGLDDVPQAGERFYVVKSEREAKQIVEHRLEEKRAVLSGQSARLNLEDFFQKLQGVTKPELKLIVKADVQGSAEAVKNALEKLSNDKVDVKIIHYGVGAVNETDINLATASKAVVVGFNVRPDPNARRLAQSNHVDIHFYNIIYELLEDIKKLQQGLLPVTAKETVIGRAEVRQLFNIPKVGTVAGVAVLEGKILRSAMVRVLRDSVEVHKGKLSSLKRFKDDVREVVAGYECGIGLENYNDIQKGDILEAYQIEEQRPPA